MKEADYSAWARREQFEFFSKVSDPFYSISFEVDVTALRGYTSRMGISFYYALTWLVTKAINRTDAFMYGLHDGRLVRYEKRDPSFTDLHKGSEAFHIVTMAADDDIIAFSREAKEKSEAQTCFLDTSSESDGLIYISCVPWLPMTGFVTERDFNADDSVPRLTWGKYQKRGDALILNMTLDANHRFIDGLHIGQFYKALCDEIEKLAAADTEFSTF